MAAVALAGTAWMEEINVVEAGPHHRVVQAARPVKDKEGRSHLTRSRWTELATGLNRWNASARAWVPAEAAFEQLPSGHFVARKTQHQVILPLDLSKEPVDFLAPDGQTRLVSVPLGVALLDRSTGKSVLLGELRPTQGYLDGPTRIVYPSALEGIEADLVFEISLGGFEQSIVVREPIPAPSELGLDAATPPEALRVIVMTEFLEAPEPLTQVRPLKQTEEQQRQAGWSSPVLEDHELAFGSGWRMVEGKAFKLGEAGRDIPVGKAWEDLGNAEEGSRRFLLESCDYVDLAPLLQVLPRREASVSGARKYRTASNGKLRFDGMRRRVEWNEARVGTRERLDRLTAVVGNLPRQQWASLETKPGVVLDYQSLNSSQTDFVFRSQSTYLITGTVNLYGTTVLEGGSVLKYPPYAAGLSVYVRGSFDCQTLMYQTAVLCARDDHTVGEVIGTASLAGRYGDLPLYFYNTGTSVYLHDVRFSHLNYGPCFYMNATNRLRHVQIANGKNGLYVNQGGPVEAGNLLIANLTAGGRAIEFAGTQASLTGEHWTVHSAPALHNGGTAITLRNSLLAGVTTVQGYSGSGNAVFSSDTDLFETFGAGGHYLYWETHRNTCSLSIDDGLLKDLRQRTTRAGDIGMPANPVGPYAQRDTGLLLDRGYHYAPIDYLLTSLGENRELTNGVAVALTGDGQSLLSQYALSSVGTPQAPNRILRYQAVQEGYDTSLGELERNDKFLVRLYDYYTLTNAVHLEFTHLYALSGGGGLIAVGNQTTELGLVDCELYGGQVVDLSPAVDGRRDEIRNCLFHSVALSLGVGGGDDPTNNFPVTVGNCLFRRSGLWLYPPWGNGWGWRDNLFDETTVTQNTVPLASTCNAYVQSGRLWPAGVSDLVLSSVTYAAGPLGGYYLPSGSPLRDAGSLSASAAGLYHYTTSTDQTREGMTRVDVSYHYAAVDPSPLGLVGYWRMDEGSGTTAFDSSGYGHQGSLINGVSRVTGMVGSGALSFDGSNDYVTVANTTVLQLTGDLTVALWMKRSSDPGTSRQLFGKGSGTQRNYSLMHETGTGKILFQQNTSAGATLSLSSATSLTSGIWYHVTVVRQGNAVSLYLNGRLDASGTFASAATTASTDALLIGAQTTAAGYFPGVLDDVRLYKRALSAAEVTVLADATAWDANWNGVPNYVEDPTGVAAINAAATAGGSGPTPTFKVNIQNPRNGAALP